MFKRLLVSGILLAMPLSALADDASELGPQTNSANASSPQTLNMLQPAGSTASPLQSADAHGGGISQSTSQALQQTGSSDQVKLMIQGEADQPQTLSGGSGINLGFLWYILAVIALAGVATGAAVLLQRPVTAKS